MTSNKLTLQEKKARSSQKKQEKEYQGTTGEGHTRNIGKQHQPQRMWQDYRQNHRSCIATSQRREYDNKVDMNIDRTECGKTMDKTIEININKKVTRSHQRHSCHGWKHRPQQPQQPQRHCHIGIGIDRPCTPSTHRSWK